jgi:septal ring factor EnvC (AmiA/AmiB activator)
MTSPYSDSEDDPQGFSEMNEGQKIEKLRRSLQGMKTQSRFLREHVKEMDERNEKLETQSVAIEAHLDKIQQQLDDVDWRSILLVVSNGIFYAILILEKLKGH